MPSRIEDFACDLCGDQAVVRHRDLNLCGECFRLLSRNNKKKPAGPKTGGQEKRDK